MRNNPPKTQIVIDCQLLQTQDRNRGMGLYFISLLKSVNRQSAAKDNSWVFILNKRLPAIRPEDQELIDKFNGAVIYADLLNKADRNLFDEAKGFNKKNLDAVVEPLLKSDSLKTVFLIPAMFSNEIYPVFPSHRTTNIMLFYDIIPFLYHTNYFQDHESLHRKDYAQRYREFYKTDLFLTISQTTADDLNLYFGVDHSRIVTILGSGANRTGLKPLSPKIASRLGKNFILMPSGDDLRKNNTLAVKAFSELGGETKLVITSRFSSESRQALSRISPNLIFTDNVSDEEYIWLIDNAKAVFFPSEYEGLGMPLLEALERNATIACSNIPVFVEINQEAFFSFDPKSTSSMKGSLQEALSASEETLNKKRQHYSSILDKFSWENAAGLFLEGIYKSKSASFKKNLAVFCPSPSSYSAVGKYAFETHAELSRFYNIDYYIEFGQTAHPNTRPNILEYAANYYPATKFDLNKAKKYDHIIYHIGNSEFHSETILNSLRLSACAVIHDTQLEGIYDYMTNRGIITKERRGFESLLDNVFKTKNTKCLASVANNQQILFCHSEYAKEAVALNLMPKTSSISQVIHPIGVPAIELSSNNSALTISFAGIISESKGISIVSRVSDLGNLNIKVFGFGILGDSPLLSDTGTNVEVIKDLTDKEFQDMLRKSDILVNYRSSYHGETSRSTLEAMRHGAVVIVRRIGWFDELPDDTVVKVDSELEAVEAVRSFIEEPALLKKISKAARTFLANQYSYGRYAKLIKEGLEQ